MLQQQVYIYVTAAFWEAYEQQRFPYAPPINGHRLLVTTPTELPVIKSEHGGEVFEQGKTSAEIIEALTTGLTNPVVCSINEVSEVNAHFTPPDEVSE
ncbi:hypothetical protein [Pseudoalteromonas sp. S1688]|uniref:hypothetical protein n=1 Tax=Pseudoalteromonas sp. S1688 TaxID=579511 RepID=UPI00110AC6A7|nr:hypothetical protein [Pseudoalteromonas sp. S1688]TMP51486.1 hypothetical protein CWB81_06050 [Pseudoalteromonas sp. S1688]